MALPAVLVEIEGIENEKTKRYIYIYIFFQDTFESRKTFPIDPQTVLNLLHGTAILKKNVARSKKCNHKNVISLLRHDLKKVVS